MVLRSEAGVSGGFSARFEPLRVYAICAMDTSPRVAAYSRAQLAGQRRT